MTPPSDVTLALSELSEGRTGAASRLLPLIYEELRDLANYYLSDEPCDHTLQPTALVHEVYLRIISQRNGTWKNKSQFFAIAAQAMRHLLIDHARRRRTVKRGGNRRKLSLDAAAPMAFRDEYLVALDDALTELAKFDPQLSKVVELRFFGGLTIEETARVLENSPMTVKRLWKVAQGWLHREIMKGD
ncbi:MAG: sigma-70 family RNA polymerase sigma factor [Phycisphaerales bacterium]|nr:sigma-70 family RNA polymerase sigma factor [Phycisphaerales bacterium]